MTQETATTPSMEETNELQQWWTNTTFDGKQFCTLRDDGTLVLNATQHTPDRTISKLKMENAAFAVKALQEKFPEVEAHVKELENEWEQTAEKVKLLSKVLRLKEYLLHTNAIGNFEMLFSSVLEKENILNKIVDEHYESRLKLVQDAEEKSKNSEDWKETTQLFREVGEQWKNIGFVDKGRNDELWNRLEAARLHFYERKRAHHEEHEKEMLQNLDLKLEIAEKAEALKDSEDWKAVTEKFKELLESWKGIGRTMHDKNEELWNRFIAAKNHFFERKKIHFEQIQTEQQTNYDVKLALVEKAESLKASEDWNVTTNAFADIMEQWKNTGRVPIEKADELWNRLSEAKDHFFNAKRAHHESVRVMLDDNYAKKMALLKRAEAIKNSTQWRSATDEMNELMDEWKKTGPVPREHSNKIWDEFLGARKFFFDRKDADREQRKEYAAKQAQRRIEQKQTFIAKLEEEINEEKQKLIDFKNAIENVTPGNKEEELRAHLTKLITQCEHKIAQKEKKVAEVKNEYDAIVKDENHKEEN